VRATIANGLNEVNEDFEGVSSANDMSGQEAILRAMAKICWCQRQLVTFGLPKTTLGQRTDRRSRARAHHRLRSFPISLDMRFKQNDPFFDSSI
jgi:hypothetical protein